MTCTSSQTKSLKDVTLTLIDVTWTTLMLIVKTHLCVNSMSHLTKTIRKRAPKNLQLHE